MPWPGGRDDRRLLRYLQTHRPLLGSRIPVVVLRPHPSAMARRASRRTRHTPSAGRRCGMSGQQDQPEPMVEAALGYAKADTAVFPCYEMDVSAEDCRLRRNCDGHDAKSPRTDHGHKDAGTDTHQI